MTNLGSSRNMRSNITGLAVALLILGACGAIAKDARANEPAEPLSPYARTGFAEAEETEAVFVGFVNSRGSPTTARFQIGKTKSYGRWFPPGQPEHFYSGYHPSEVEQAVDGLRPATTYHFRLVATSEGGVTYGKDETFRTLPAEPNLKTTHECPEPLNGVGGDPFSAIGALRANTETACKIAVKAIHHGHVYRQPGFQTKNWTCKRQGGLGPEVEGERVKCRRGTKEAFEFAWASRGG
jgi:hypothetical protein